MKAESPRTNETPLHCQHEHSRKRLLQGKCHATGRKSWAPQSPPPPFVSRREGGILVHGRHGDCESMYAHLELEGPTVCSRSSRKTFRTRSRSCRPGSPGKRGRIVRWTRETTAVARQ